LLNIPLPPLCPFAPSPLSLFAHQTTDCLPGILGDEFALRDAGALYCKEDHDVLEKSSQSSLTSSSVESNNNISSSNNNNTNLSNNNHSSELGSMSGECPIWPLILAPATTKRSFEWGCYWGPDSRWIC